MILSDLELTLPHAASARDGLRPRSLTELLGRRDEPHLWFGLGRRRAPRDRHPACARRRRTSSCTPSRSFGRPSASLLPSRVSCETFCTRRAPLVVRVGFFGRPRARKRRGETASHDLERGEVELLAAARRFRARRPPSDLVDGAPWATRRFFSLVRRGRRHAPGHRHPAFAGGAELAAAHRRAPPVGRLRRPPSCARG